jgi:hypothetical protein
MKIIRWVSDAEGCGIGNYIIVFHGVVAWIVNFLKQWNPPLRGAS